MDIKMIGGGELPPALKDLLAEKLGIKTENADSVKPARMDQIRDLLENPVKFEVGDIVTLKANTSKLYRFPRPGEKVIVTQSLDVPYRTGDSGGAESATPYNIALALFDDEIGENGLAFESLYDSRHFVKVGSIYDPIYTDNGEKLDVD